LDLGEEVGVCFVRHAGGEVVGKRGAAHRDGDSERVGEVLMRGVRTGCARRRWAKSVKGG
jgi:hypothetical protein